MPSRVFEAQNETTAESVDVDGAGKNFAIMDAAMNDLLRPSLYQAWHGVLSVREHSVSDAKPWDLVGPICESGDCQEPNTEPKRGRFAGYSGTGAYGSSLSSNYNTRNRAEVMVSGDRFGLSDAARASKINCRLKLKSHDQLQ